MSRYTLPLVTALLIASNSVGQQLTGTISLSNVDVTFVGKSFGDLAGYAITSAGDVNGDGFDDLLIGARDASPSNRNAAGETYLIYGKPDSSPLASTINLSNADATFNGSILADRSSAALSAAGDVNGDGLSDFLIGAPFADSSQFSGNGKSYLFYGKSGQNEISGTIDLNTGADVTFFGVDGNDQSGFSVSSAGDFNNDGFDDILVGAYVADPVTVSGTPGEAYVVYGGSGGNALSSSVELINADLVIPGLVSGDHLGRDVSVAGDFNGDGIDDILVAARRHDPFSTTQNATLNNAGEIYLIYGQTTANQLTGNFDLNNADVKFESVLSGSETGESISNAGDINGDGIDDLLIGSRFGGGTGKSYLIYGKSGANEITGSFTLDQADVVFDGISSGDEAGRVLSAAGDVNGDGIDDLIIGARNAHSNTGEAYLVYGKSGASALSGTIDLLNADATFTGINTGDRAGISVAAVGDVNNDGFDDLLIGASERNGDTGEAYLIYGKGSVTVVAGDFDGSGTVDHADYQLFITQYGQTGTLSADGNQDGVVNAADYTIWRDNYSSLASSLVTSVAIPEPTSLILFASLLFANSVNSRRSY